MEEWRAIILWDGSHHSCFIALGCSTLISLAAGESLALESLSELICYDGVFSSKVSA
jgi:hypothetical protein